MSLSSHLTDRHSPVRAFFEATLPNTRPVVASAALSLRAGCPRAPFAAAPEVNAGRAGTAADYLLRFALAPDPLPPNAAADCGAAMLGDLSTSALYAVDDARARVAQLAAHRRDVNDQEWEELAQISLLLATFEMVFRAGGMLPAFLLDLDYTPDANWRGWAALTCQQAELEDVAVLGWTTASDHADLRGKNLWCNPEFCQTAALRGADADLITHDGVLLDFKSTSTPRVISRVDVWQLCGYALADTDDEYAITAVGLSALRWRTRVVWSLDSLLSDLGATPANVAALRTQFAKVLAS